MALSSCSAPIAYRKQEARIPAVAIVSASHSDALAHLKAAGASGDSECCPIQRQLARVVKRRDLDSVIAGLWLAREVGK
jgi:hypothetical protein